jgi:O-antigen ligase
MHLIYRSYLTKENYLNLLIFLMPASFIAGNMIININIILLILSAIFFFKKGIFNLKYYFLDKLIFSFFLFIIFTGFYNDIYFYLTDAYPKGINTIIKSILFLKYLFLYLTIRFLIEQKIINLKYFYYSCSLCSLFLCIDLFYQFIYKKDIFGYEIIFARKLSGPFGDELIAGGYLQRFSLFTFFILPYFYNNFPKKILIFLIPFIFFITSIAIVLTGNRMPFVLYIFTVFLIVIFQKQTRKYLIPFLIIFIISMGFFLKSNSMYKKNFKSFYNQVANMSALVIGKPISDRSVPNHVKEFSTFYDTWLMNKYIGGGIKNFRYYCHVRPNQNKESILSNQFIDNKKQKFICNMHPHNYYLEILTETGLVGFLILTTIFLIVLYESFYKKYFTKLQIAKNNIIVPFIFLFIAEIFPIKSTGSFFTTGNATFYFLIMAIIIGLVRKDNLIENKS